MMLTTDEIRFRLNIDDRVAVETDNSTARPCYFKGADDNAAWFLYEGSLRGGVEPVELREARVWPLVYVSQLEPNDFVRPATGFPEPYGYFCRIDLGRVILSTTLDYEESVHEYLYPEGTVFALISKANDPVAGANGNVYKTRPVGRL